MQQYNPNTSESKTPKKREEKRRMTVYLDKTKAVTKENEEAIKLEKQLLILYSTLFFLCYYGIG